MKFQFSGLEYREENREKRLFKLTEVGGQWTGG